LLIAAGACVLLPVRTFGQPLAGRHLKLKNANTGETFSGFYRNANGPILEAMADLAVLLRDHHANRTGPVDIAVLDFLADVLDAVGQTSAMILSAYRTLETNAKLAATMFGVAEKSQHILGRAVDISLDSRLVDAEIAARKMKRGGVGWYPHSQFIHLDSGPVRSWEMDGSGLDRLLAGQSLELTRRGWGHPSTVSDRMTMQQALARREFLARRRVPP